MQACTTTIPITAKHAKTAQLRQRLKALLRYTASPQQALQAHKGGWIQGIHITFGS